MFRRRSLDSNDASIDADRPLRRAILVMWILAALYFTAAAGAMFLKVYPAFGSRAKQISAMAAFFGTPGAIHLLGAIFIKQRKYWAVMLGLLGAMLDLATTLALSVDGISFCFARHKWLPGLLIPPISAMLLVVAAYLILNLARTMSILQPPPIGIRRGFEPLGVKLITPVETGQDNAIPNARPAGDPGKLSEI